METWKDVPGYEGYYKVSDIGRVMSLDRFDGRSMLKSKLLKPNLHTNGYYKHILSQRSVRKSVYIHRIVAAAFLGISSFEVDHIDGNKANNSVSNLRYCTHRENQSFSNRKHLNRVSSQYVGVFWCNTKSR